MEFSIWCPTDGTVTVGLDDIDSIVVRSGSDVEVELVCPLCGGRISLAARVPRELLEVLDEAWVRVDDGEPSMIKLRREGSEAEEAQPANDHIDAYCEYFRRELSQVETAADILAEIDHTEKG